MEKDPPTKRGFEKDGFSEKLILSCYFTFDFVIFPESRRYSDSRFGRQS